MAIRQSGVPRVSVIIPTHNASRHLAAAVESILGQTYQSIEVVLVDDGSIDSTRTQIDAYAASDARVRPIHLHRVGTTRALNIGWQASHGEYVARMDADDIALPDRLAKQVAHLDRHPRIVACGCWMLRIDEDGDPVGVSIWPIDHDTIDAGLLAGQGGLAHPTAMVRRDALAKVGGYRTRFPVAQDKDLWLRLAEVGKLANLAEVLLHYRERQDSTSATRQHEQREAVRQAVFDARRRRRLPEVPWRVEECSQRDEAAIRYGWAKTALKEGYRKTARKHIHWLTQHAAGPFARWRLRADLYLRYWADRYTHRRRVPFTPLRDVATSE